MSNEELKLRPAVAEDSEAIARVFSPSLRLLSFLPALYTPAQERRFIADVIMKDCAVTLAEQGGSVVSFLARDREEIRLLHTHPDFIGRGAGALLLTAAKASGVAALELWCFQANRRARRFYEAHGFRPIAFTDGARNEEKLPDLRYRWARAGDP